MQICTSLETNNHASTPPLSFLQAGCPSCHPTNSVKALKEQHLLKQHRHVNKLNDHLRWFQSWRSQLNILLQWHCKTWHNRNTIAPYEMSPHQRYNITSRSPETTEPSLTDCYTPKQLILCWLELINFTNHSYCTVWIIMTDYYSLTLLHIFYCRLLLYQSSLQAATRNKRYLNECSQSTGFGGC